MFFSLILHIRTTNTTMSVMRLVSKNEQILHVYFVAKKKKKNTLCFYFIYIYILFIYLF